LLALTVLIVVLVLVGRYLGRNPDPVAALAKRIAGWPPLRFVGRAYRSGFGWLAARVGTNGAVAVNILGGVLVLLFIGYAPTWTVDRLVRHSGLPLVDPPIVEWMKARREPRLVVVAIDLLSALRGSYLMILVGLAAAGLSWHYRGWRANLIGLLGTGGAIVPLALIALATDWERRAGRAARQSDRRGRGEPGHARLAVVAPVRLGLRGSVLDDRARHRRAGGGGSGIRRLELAKRGGRLHPARKPVGPGLRGRLAHPRRNP
jgi:hypothetical protein